VTQIAPTAVVDKTAQLGEDVSIGPGCVIGPNVALGDGSELRANVYIAHDTILGRNNLVYANCVLGEEPQIVGALEIDTKLIIGDNNTFRENVTINAGSSRGQGRTVVGNNNYFMIGSHLGHDCEVEDDCMIGNYVQMAGHIKLERNVWLNGFTAAQPFVTIGRFTYTAGMSTVHHDLPPFVRAGGVYPCEVRGLNVIGLQRAGFAELSIQELMKAFRYIFRRRGEKSIAQAVEDLANENGLDENVRYLLDSLQRSHQHRSGRYRELSRH
jgi:UDP-N-acetylglucosamine acyltransferase